MKALQNGLLVLIRLDVSAWIIFCFTWNIKRNHLLLETNVKITPSKSIVMLVSQFWSSYFSNRLTAISRGFCHFDMRMTGLIPGGPYFPSTREKIERTKGIRVYVRPFSIISCYLSFWTATIGDFCDNCHRQYVENVVHYLKVRDFVKISKVNDYQFIAILKSYFWSFVLEFDMGKWINRSSMWSNVVFLTVFAFVEKILSNGSIL